MKDLSDGFRETKGDHFWRGIMILALTAVAVIHPLTGLANPSEVLTLDEKFAMVGTRVPTFGGAYLGADGTLVILLTVPSEEAARQSHDALAEILGDDFATEKYTFLEARYSFLDLKRWYEALIDIQQVAPDLVFTDIDEKRNRIVIALEDPDRHRAAVEAELARQGIPRDAVILKQSDPFRTKPLPGAGLRPTLYLVGFLAILLLGVAALVMRRRRRFAPTNSPSM